MADQDLVRCANCGQANRVPEVTSGKKAICGKCRAPLTTSFRGPLTVTDATFGKLIGGGQPVVIDFWAPWCGPCVKMAPIIDELAESAGGFLVGKMNVDENPITASRYRIQGIPTLIFFANGSEAGRIVGAAGRAQIDAGIRQYLAL